jgi:bidirectional [NiFe] hydrogenase diaphorase subunit
VTTSAIDRLRGLAEQSGVITASEERLVASELRVPVAAVHGAATFFEDLAPTRRGRRHVRVCEGTSCFAADRGQHIGEVEQALGVTTGRCREDGAVSLQAVRCIGFCYAAPALLDGDTPRAGPDIAGQLTTEQAADPRPIPVTAVVEPVLLGGIFGRGRSVAELAGCHPVLAAAAADRRGCGLRFARARRCRISGRGQVGRRSQRGRATLRRRQR